MAKTAGLNVVGLSLGDGNLTTATQLDAELGHVATVQPKQVALLNALLNADFLPIISSIAIDDDGRLMNVNADQAATAIATLLQAELVMLSDVDGVLDQQKSDCRTEYGSNRKINCRTGDYRWYDCQSESGSDRSTSIKSSR